MSFFRALVPFAVGTALVIAFVPAVSAHPGGLDKQGGHTDRKTGTYHCHTDTCRQQHQQQAEAEQEAREAGRAFSTLYDRDDWPHWDDEDGDCQNSRAEALIRASQAPVSFTRKDHCIVATGRWYDPYSGRTFTRARQLDVDHIVPLRHAHGHGGNQWNEALRRQFANDPDNLLVVSASANRSKGANSPDQWLPANHAYWCEYGQRWSAIKQRYQLMITPPEQEAVARLLASCASE
ncbi:MAG: HNH endonuclease [Pseudomonadales bacterium]|nr:HNH endonuclease [Pseudomonadales bacterium]